PPAFLGLRHRAMRSLSPGDGIGCPALPAGHLEEARQHAQGRDRPPSRARGLSSHLRNDGLGGSAWSRLSLRCTIGRDSLGLRSMTLVVVSIYLAAVLFCWGSPAVVLP